MRLVSWNVNGVRAVASRGDLDWLFAGEADVVCLQETKIQESAVSDALRSPAGFCSYWTFGKKKGYSGTAIFVKAGLVVEPFDFRVGAGAHPEYDTEGRVVGVDFGSFVLLNVYFPNGGSNGERLAFKHAWHDAFLDELQKLAARRPVVVCGDFNVAHRPIDLALPQKWSTVSGFLPEERAWFDRLVHAGFVDTFRAEKGDLERQFTFWETRVDARRENLGWRIDYFVVSKDLEERIVDAWISPQIFGSDHCPTGLELDVRVQKTALAAQGVTRAGSIEVRGVQHDVVDDAFDDVEGVDEDHGGDDDDEPPRYRR